MSYTGQTIQEEPETSDDREIGYERNYIILTGPTITMVGNKFEEEQQVDEEAIKVLENKNYQAVLTPIS